MTLSLFELSPAIDRATAAAQFAQHGRVQIRDVLTPESASNLARVLHRETPWGFAYFADGGPPAVLRMEELQAASAQRKRDIAAAIHRSAAAGDYAARFGRYPLVEAYLQGWAPGGAHDLLLEHINDTPFLDLVRHVTDIPELVKADAQATSFAPGDFLSIHTDSHVAEGWRVAYVLHLTGTDWKPDWGGYLNFFDEEGDIVAGWKPRFNTLNLLKVPQPHHVSYVPPFAPAGRMAITGWCRDR
ncbi:hypothetical protein CA233_12745 [Sphingomonas sp. ABOLD]|uniref:Rps23 Pro-64 3,4-dihydroxylase Tpa1-like proline 4-hydroxylase n=1 Tax=Sphingomonas trueperi TaxID=53317 RepID=A0A7X6BDP5_9SPHN|nr:MULTISPECIES: 2OG-Fe(II) oxygenase family protein [unclassified Sphingomonas]NJB98116.1 Rps23 Pro-64 3,4-dihydroxylase Tpa1-like proline 4-hydroxylase [Sphingomonas trueperi]RSV42285.1 hypothetical protein CA234_07720 [Sphingomonas sp. ABOLE]RSV46353.1 hypothetical protein CA233_12745 [Sphingomonas sp. ABOLD]